MCQEPKKLAELGVRNFGGDFNACNKELKWKVKQFCCDQDYDLPKSENDSSL